MKKRLFIVCLCLGIALTGCGSSASADSGAYETAAAAEESYYSYEDKAYETSEFSSGYDSEDYAPEEVAIEDDVEYEEGATKEISNEDVEEYGSKIIRNASLSLDVGNLEEFADNLKKTVTDYGGYMESMDVNSYDSEYSESRYGYFTVRIPASKLDDFLNIVKDEGVVTQKSESAEDVTLQYVDVEARIATYEAERDSLMELLDKANTLKDIITLRDKIADVNYELDSLNRQLKSMQNKVSYSTVNVNAKETRTLAGHKGEKSFWSKVGENFTSEMEDGLETAIDLLIWLVTRLPLFAILALVVFIIVKIIKAIIGKSGKEKKSKPSRAEKKAMKAQEKNNAMTASVSALQGMPNENAPVNEGNADQQDGNEPVKTHYTSND